jgi:hypothetical protein
MVLKVRSVERGRPCPFRFSRLFVFVHIRILHQ